MIIVICGPTGVGKTKLSIELAKKYNAVIINSDSTQVYKGMDIATAKVTKEETEGIKHYLLDICDVNEDYSIYNFQNDCRKVISENHDKNIIIVGGSGLYQKAALYDYNLKKEEVISDAFDLLSNEELYKLVKEKNPSSDIHINNKKRLLRELRRENKDQSVPKLMYDNVIFIGLTTDRENLYNIINNRVDKMVKNGLIEEARKFYNLKIDCKSLKTVIGYKELFKYFDGACSLDEALDEIKKKSRNYAKRQYTWYNHQVPTIWIETNYEDFSKTIDKAVEIIEKNKPNN